jgi:hypothetical protein
MKIIRRASFLPGKSSVESSIDHPRNGWPVNTVMPEGKGKRIAGNNA